MPQIYSDNPAFGGPGIEPRWTRSDKQVVGTSYSASSRLWYTVAAGVISEIYFPTVDRPQIRDLQFLISDGETFAHREWCDMDTTVEELSPNALGYRITNRDCEGRYALTKEVLADPHHSCLLVHARLEADESILPKLRLYVILRPHLEVSGWGNNGNVVEVDARRILAAHKERTCVAMGANVPFSRLSCGYVGASDGWTDLQDGLEMDWQFDSVTDGNIALTGQLDISNRQEFTLALGVGHGLQHAVSMLLQSLATPFALHRERFLQQWEEVARDRLPLEDACGDDGRLYHTSQALLIAHEDKTYPGAMIASLSIPWGEATSAPDANGYHLVWTRDMTQSVTGLLAVGNTEAPRRALIYLATAQNADGSFPQNFWVNGEAHWQGMQLDEIAFPIVLAWRLDQADALRDFDPYPLVLRAAGYLIRRGPVTPQERWEEESGFSPSTLAICIAALVCAGDLARDRGDTATADFLEAQADFMERHVEPWTVTTEGTLVPEIPRHYIRLTPASPDEPHPNENPNEGEITIHHREHEEDATFPAKEIVDAGFLELVRYGIRSPDDPLIVDSLKVVDAVLKVDTPHGPCWHRYNYDGYGQKSDGGPYDGKGIGRAWPLLAGERGHYEMAAGRDPRPYVRAMEGFANEHRLLPEQVWDEPDKPQAGMIFGEAIGAAMPLCWAHAEYIKLLRSIHDGRVFDRIGVVEDRYLKRRGGRDPDHAFEVWKFNRQVTCVPAGSRLQIQASTPFQLRWTCDEWENCEDVTANATPLGVTYVDLSVSEDQRAPVRFTFFWTEESRWEGRDFKVEVDLFVPTEMRRGGRKRRESRKVGSKSAK